MTYIQNVDLIPNKIYITAAKNSVRVVQYKDEWAAALRKSKKKVAELIAHCEHRVDEQLRTILNFQKSFERYVKGYR